MTPWSTRTDTALGNLGVTRRPRSLVGTLVAALLAAAVVASPAGTAQACTCDDQLLATYAEEAIAAFMGRQTDRVVEDEFAENGTALTFDVEEVFLGDVSTELRVRTQADFDACGVDLDGAGVVGILVFEYRGEPTVGACPAAVSRAELESAFGPSASPIEPDEDAADAGSSRSNSVARAAVIGLLLVILVAGAVVVRRRRQQSPSDLR